MRAREPQWARSGGFVGLLVIMVHFFEQAGRWSERLCFSAGDSHRKREEGGSVLIYLRSLYLRMDDCVANLTHSLRC